MRVVRDVYERYGFEPLETPAFENIETLLGKYGEEGNKLIFKILRRGEHEASGEADLALRYDLTVPLARVVAQYQNELPKFFKRYQIQPVWRADRPARGRFREFYQCDIDAIGSTSPVVEAELLAAVSEVLDAAGLRGLRHQAQSPAAADGAARQRGVPADAARRCARRARQAGQDRRRRRRRQEARGIEASAADSVPQAASAAVSCRRTPSDSAATGSSASSSLATTPDRGALPKFATIVGSSNGTRGRAAGFGSIRAWRAGCHTTRARSWRSPSPDLAGSLGGGGRYDNLVGMFLGRDVPACGFSLGLERIIVVMTERGMFPAASPAAPSTSW